MKIDRIEITTLAVPRKGIGGRTMFVEPISAKPQAMDIVLAKVHTDEGITGLGEIPPIPPETRETADEIFAFMKTYLGPKLIGEDPFNVDRIWEMMNKQTYCGVCTKGIIDIALYDLRGKALKTPVYNLLGGLYKERFPITLTIGWGRPEEMAQRAKAMKDAGYTTLRLKIGQPLETDLAVLKAVRDQVGWDFGLRGDANQAWTVPKAIKNIKAMEKYDLEFVEQPVAWHDLKGMAEVAKAVDVPITAHESMYTLQDVDNLIKLGGMDVIGVKAYRPGGGLTGTMKVLGLAEIMNIPCYLHSAAEAGICTAASAHIVASQYRHLDYTTEMTGLSGCVSELVTNPVKIQGGFAEVPKGPGLGVELDEEAVKKFTRETAVIK